MIKLYNGVTADDRGTTNGREVTESNKITFVLNSSENQEDVQALAIRCDEGYKTVSEITLELDGNSKRFWALSLDNQSFANWGESIVLSEEVLDTNRIIYIKAKAEEGEGAKIDTSCTVRLTCTIGVNG